MEQLNNYFRLKEIDRIESEKKCLITLKKIINICLKKGYLFSIHFSDDDGGINLTTDGYTTSFNSYFKGTLINYSNNKDTFTVFQLLDKLKNPTAR